MEDLSNENVIHVVQDDIEYIQFRKLLEYEDILRHCFTLRVNKMKNEEFDFAIKLNNRHHAIENCHTICNYLGLSANDIVRPIQTHTNNVVALQHKFKDAVDLYPKELNEVDGVITDKKNIVLSTGYADCTPLLFFDPVKKVIGNSHSGWVGTVKKIGQKTIEKMVNVYGCNPKDIIVCIAPTIRVCDFEVETDVKEQFEEAFGNDDNIIFKTDNPEKFFIDTVFANKKALMEMGVLSENIIDSNLCTVCHKDKMFSYRGNDAEDGRSTAIIALV